MTDFQAIMADFAVRQAERAAQSTGETEQISQAARQDMLELQGLTGRFRL